MDNNEEEIIGEDIDAQSTNNRNSKKHNVKDSSIEQGKFFDLVDAYRDAGGVKGMAKQAINNAIDNKKNELKDKVKEKINDKKDRLKEKIDDKKKAVANKVDDKLPESVKKKRDALKNKTSAMKKKIDATKQKAEDLKNLKSDLNEKAFRKGFKVATSAIAPGVGAMGEKLLDTEKGKSAIEAARGASTPTAAIKEGTKEIIKVVARIKARQNMIPILSSVLVFLVVIFIVIASVSPLANAFNYFKGNENGEIGMDTIEEDFREFYESIQKYATANPAMTVAVLTAHTDNDEYDSDSGIEETVDSCTEEEISNGDCIATETEDGLLYSKSKMKRYIKKVNKAIEDSGRDVSEGDYEDPQNTGSKFFKWLYNDFVEDYYSEFIDKDAIDKSKSRIIQEIYLLYKELNNGNSCTNSFVNLTCPSVTVTGDSAGTYELEEYIAAVVAMELGYSGYPEAIRAQAIAARTYLFSVTDNCKISIENSTNQQTMDLSRVNDEIKQAAQDTAGMVLTNNGEVFMSQYSTFSPKMNCNGTVCTGTFYKQPSYTQSTITIDVGKLGFYTNNLLGGHEYGMSQYGALYLDKIEKKSYQEILKTFYDENVEISSTTTSNIAGDLGGYCGSNGGGLVQIEGYSARLSRPLRDNSFYYDQTTNTGANGWYEGECAWYASGRAQEVLSTLNSPVKWTYNGNGGDFCSGDNYDRDKFEVSYDVNSPRIGSIVSWRYGEFGHVAVVEKVEGNQVTISEAGLSYGPTYLHGCGDGSCVRPFVTNTDAQRREYCEADGSGCFTVETLDISEIKNSFGQFQCYIYLGSPK